MPSAYRAPHTDCCRVVCSVGVARGCDVAAVWEASSWTTCAVMPLCGRARATSRGLDAACQGPPRESSHESRATRLGESRPKSSPPRLELNEALSMSIGFGPPCTPPCQGPPRESSHEVPPSGLGPGSSVGAEDLGAWERIGLGLGRGDGERGWGWG